MLFLLIVHPEARQSMMRFFVKCTCLPQPPGDLTSISFGSFVGAKGHRLPLADLVVASRWHTFADQIPFLTVDGNSSRKQLILVLSQRSVPDPQVEAHLLNGPFQIW